MSDLTVVLASLERGEPGATDQLLPLVYNELRQLAAQRLACERPGHTLQATALVHEAYMRLVGPNGAAPGFNSRNHFFAAAAEAMRRILVESARSKGRAKRGGQWERQNLDVAMPQIAPPTIDLLDVNAAVDELASVDPPKAELVKLRYFAGLTLEEAAAILGISRATADRHWKYARAWLADRLRDQGSPAGRPGDPGA